MEFILAKPSCGLVLLGRKKKGRFYKFNLRGLVVRSIGLERAKSNVALTSLVYNVCRFIQIRRYHSDWLVQEAL